MAGRGLLVSRTLIVGGSVVSPCGVEPADLLIEGETVREVGRDLPREADRAIDAEGRLVLPGAIDVHVHPVYLDDLEGSSITAAHGGVTTLIHFAYAKPGTGLLEAIRRFREEGEAGSILDFALHGGLFDAASQASEIPDAIREGITSFKMFMTYAKLGWMTDDYQLMRTLDLLGRSGGMGMVHAENGLATDYFEDRFKGEGRNPVDVFVDTRPAILEAEAVHRAIAMAHVAGCPLYIPHVSARLALDEIARAKGRGLRVYAETCPQYLTLTNDDLLRQGPLLKIGPPLRDQTDRLALWEAVADGRIDCVASDHAPKAKRRDDDFEAAPYGSPQIETMLPLLLSEGVSGGRLSLPRLVDVLCETPARIFGLHPQKGVLQPGSDADLLLVDLEAVWTIDVEGLHSNAGYTPYEGREVRGRVDLVMQRGEVIVERGELRGRSGRGRFLRTRAA
jgi:dihydropyrimidinase